MKRSVVQTLILTDWQRHWVPMMIAVAAGALSLGLMWVGGELPFILGATLFFTGLIVLGCMVPQTNVIYERKKQTLAFVMSMPVSVTQFTVAKIASTFGMYLIPWSILLAAALTFIFGRTDMPDGVVPVVLILMGLTFVGF